RRERWTTCDREQVTVSLETPPWPRCAPKGWFSRTRTRFSTFTPNGSRAALKGRLPTVLYLQDFPEQGGLMSDAPTYPELLRGAGAYVDKILKGVKPGDLPVEQPQKFELIVNTKTARALGLTIPSSLLVRADRTIQ